MFHLIVTNDAKLVKMARECGAGVFTAEKFPEEAMPVRTKKTHSNAMRPHEILQKLDVNPNIKGYHYLRYIMEKCEMNPHYHEKSITKEIYPECAKEFDTTSSRVERAIRHALDLSFERVPEKFSEIFGGTFAKVPTNSEFIGVVSEYFVNNK